MSHAIFNITYDGYVDYCIHRVFQSIFLYSFNLIITEREGHIAGPIILRESIETLQFPTNLSKTRSAVI